MATCRYMEFFTKNKLLIVSFTILILIFSLLTIVILPKFRIVQNEQVQDIGLKPYLQKDGASVIASEYKKEDPVVVPVKPILFEYIEIVGSCGPYFEVKCVNVRSGPGLNYPIVSKLRNNIVLKVGKKVERDGQYWYKIVFDEWVRYPGRVKGDWYVSAEYARVFWDEGASNYSKKSAITTKRIVVELTSQMLYAYDGDELFMQESISTGLKLTETPRGTFKIFRKTPTRYMQGPIPEITPKYWDFPGTPWNLYFTHNGVIIHGAYWHNKFGTPQSSGCVNMDPDAAEKLYKWADLGTQVIVRD